MSSGAAAVDRDDLVDREVVLRFLLSAAFWLVFAPTIGVILSIKFNYFDFLGNVSWLTWGRLRPVHVMGVVFGAFSSAIVGLTYYMVPRLCGVRMYKENWSRALVWIWNIALTARTSASRPASSLSGRT
jgi:cytochrome c oxidase cbb3-type subunit 1